jgi:S-DNA-T family DNA segregation ATPase FtsK/SpoIIIE
MSSTEQTKKPSSKSKKTAPVQPPKPPSLADRLAAYWLRFDRFGWDILGVAILALSLLTLFGLTGVTAGSFVSPWSQLLRRWIGWGAFPLTLVLVVFGVYALRRRGTGLPVIRLGRILAGEGALFALLAFLSTLGGLSLQRAEAGLDGGVIGWGLAALLGAALPAPLSTVLLFVLLVVFAWFASGLDAWLGKKVSRWAEVAQTAQPELPHMPEVVRLPVAQPPATKPAPPPKPGSRRARAEAEAEANPIPGLMYERPENLPTLDLLTVEKSSEQDTEQIKAIGAQIEKTLAEFGVPAHVIGFRVGPTVTQYAVEPGYVEKPGPDGQMVRQKVRVSQISTLSRDLARALAAERLRIEAPVPGHSYMGVEVPNLYTTLVRLRPILESEAFNRSRAPLTIALGKDVSGLPMVADLAKMPHLLVAGTTGSGKSVCIAAITTCLVMNNSPEELRIAMLDPKMVELVRFNGLPHLLGKVETKLDRMLAVLQWAINEMDRRYRLLEEARSRDLETYNRKMARRKHPTLPRIVLLIDELADLMMTAPDQTEHNLVRLAQMARATGIHLVVATQRPSTDVVTGLIKANFPARIAFSVASSVDSRVILDTNGAETLLGRGDMLFLSPEVGLPQRAQGVMVSDHEIEKVISYWQQTLAGKEPEEAPWEEMMSVSEENSDELVEKAVALVKRTQRASASWLQRQLRIGYPRAARLLDQLEEMGVVGPSTGGGRDREVLLGPDDSDESELEEEDR